MVLGWLFGYPVPRHQFIDAVLRPAVDKTCQQIDAARGVQAGAAVDRGLDNLGVDVDGPDALCNGPQQG